MRIVLFLIFCLCALPVEAQRVLRVNAAVPDGGDGTSWSTAFRSLQDALAAADEGDTLWVVQGRYRPDDGAGITQGDRDAAFGMKAGLHLLGGFRGEETRAAQRDPARYETVLTGDLLGNDRKADSLHVGAPSRQDNAKTLVRVAEGVGGVYLSGFTIRDASGGAALRSSGALVVEDAIVTRNAGFTTLDITSDRPHRFARMLIHDNVSDDGGALRLSAGRGPVYGLAIALEDVMVRDNRALNWGGGIAFYTADVALDISNCRFERNTAYYGGAIYSGKTSGARLRIQNTVFARNEAQASGGAIEATNLAMEIANTVFAGNRASGAYGGEGGALFLFEDDGFTDSTRITSSTFYGNVARRAGASIFFQRSTRVRVLNSLFAGGAVTEPGGGDFDGTAELASWRPSWYASLEERTEFSHTLAGGGFPYFAADLGGTLDAASGLCDPLGPDGILGTADDDLHLCPGSPAIDAGDDTLLLADVLDLDGDGDTAEPLPIDLDGRQRVYSTSGPPRVDLGAFEADAPVVAAEPADTPAAAALGVRLYPNPARAVVQVEWGAATGAGAVAVFDVLGREVLRLDAGAARQPAQHAIDVSRLPAGVYFVRVERAGRSAVAALTVLR